MFHIQFFVEDKNLAKVQWAVDGLVVDFKSVPVRNAMATKGGKMASTAARSPLEALTQLLDSAAAAGQTQATISEMKGALHAAGFAPKSYSVSLTKALKLKMLKRTKKAGVYAIVVKGSKT